MAHIAILTHELDRFPERGYLMEGLAAEWASRGHRIEVVAGLARQPKADLAVLHVDVSLVPKAYARALAKYPRVINGAATDIRKRAISQHLVRRGDDWDGPVIVKSDLNCAGEPEARLKVHRKHAGKPRIAPPRWKAKAEEPYWIADSLGDVPSDVWRNRTLVVERFMPERDERGYWLRTWVFMGEEERCARSLGTSPIVRWRNTIAREPCTVPDDLRAMRARLGFDYGKFDFVVHNGQTILFDANKTPAWRTRTAEMKTEIARLARGLDHFLR